ncbi:MAG: F0F1 ATP synthase subunit B' [Phycisphaerales bacterium]|nr:F0F1 ATP synthase subunit B' [Hyphomonadaceae bacterium]
MASPAADTHAADAAHGAAAGGEHAATFPPFDPSLFPSQLIWFAITFTALYFIVSRFILPNIAAVLAKRAGTISGDLDAAAQKSAAADEARTQMEKASAKARADARAMIDAARADVTAKLTAEQEAAETRLSVKIEAAEAKVAEARAKAMADVPAIAEALARDIADKLAPAAGGTSAPRQRAVGEA